MKTTIVPVPIKTITLKVNNSCSHKYSRSQSRQSKSHHHVRNSILVRNKNIDTLEKQQPHKKHQRHKNRLSLNLNRQNCNRQSRKGVYTPEIFNSEKAKSTILSASKTSRHLYNSDIIKKDKNNFGQQRVPHNLFPKRKIYNNKYYYHLHKQCPHQKKIHYSCTYHNHVTPINPHFLQEIFNLDLPNPEVYYRTPSSPTKERAFAYKIATQQISPWKIAKDDIYDFQ